MTEKIVVRTTFENAGAKDGKPWKRDDIVDEQDRRFSSFEFEAISKIPLSLIHSGMSLRVQFEEQTRGEFTNRMLQYVETDVDKVEGIIAWDEDPPPQPERSAPAAPNPGAFHIGVSTTTENLSREVETKAEAGMELAQIYPEPNSHFLVFRRRKV